MNENVINRQYIALYSAYFGHINRSKAERERAAHTLTHTKAKTCDTIDPNSECSAVGWRSRGKICTDRIVERV